MDKIPTRKEAVKYCKDNGYLIWWIGKTKIIYWDRSMRKCVLPIRSDDEKKM